MIATRTLKNVLGLALMAMATACSNVNENLLQMIPADATGVISIDVPTILERAGIKSDDKLIIPASLSSIVDENDDNPLCRLLTDLPYAGIDTDNHCYVFFTGKALSQVALLPLDDEKKTIEVVSRRAGVDFHDLSGLKCIYVEDNFYAVKNRVLMVARVSRMTTIEKLAQSAAGMFNHTVKNITDDKNLMKHLTDGIVNAHLTMSAVKTLLNRSTTYREMSQKMPLIEIFTESDIKSLTAQVNADDKGLHLTAHLDADENSDYVRLLNTTLSKPGDKVLAAIPSSMEYIMSMSVRGDRFVNLPQIRQLVDVFKALPYIGRIDLEGILHNVNGPFAVGLAHDPTFAEDWNAVIAATTDNPEAIIAQINRFATAMGQAPEIYDGEYIYQYENKMIKMGTTQGVLYLKMLNYEQTEGYANDIAVARNLFAASPIAFYMQPTAPFTGSHFTLGFTDHVNIKGEFVARQDSANAMLELLQILCSVKPTATYDDMATDAWDNVSGLPTSNH